MAHMPRCTDVWDWIVYGCHRGLKWSLGQLNSMVFSTDLTAVAATYIHWHVRSLRSCVTVILFLSSGSDLLVCQSQYKRRVGKLNKEWNNRPMYAMIWVHNYNNWSVELNDDSLVDLVHGETPTRLAGSTTHANAIWTESRSKAGDKRSDELETSKSDPVSISRLPNPCSKNRHSRTWNISV